MNATLAVDRLLPNFQFSESHACLLRAEPTRAIAAVADYSPASDGFYRAMIRLREGPMRCLGARTNRAKPFGLNDFTLLARREDEIVYGLVGKFWKLDYGLVPIADARAFAAFEHPEFAKLALSFQASRQADGTTKLSTQTRIYCPDRSTYLKFLPYWILIRPVSGLIRRRHLSSIRKQCEIAEV